MNRHHSLALAGVCVLASTVAACANESGSSSDTVETRSGALSQTASVAEMQPAVSFGGRAVAGSVNPSNASVAYVAAETGGVFRTSDAGATWSHLSALPQYRIADVKVNPRATSELIVTTHDDDHVTNQAGIWRSTDAGASFSRMNLSPTCNIPPFHAQGVAFAPDRDDVFAGIICQDLYSGGIAVSHDRGATWSFTDLGQGVIAVVAQANGIVDLYGTSGHQRSTNGGTRFGAAHAIPGVPQPHAVYTLAASPLNGNVLFAATSLDGMGRLFESDDAGVTWRQVAGTNSSMRQPSVVARAVGGQVRLYFSDGLWAYRNTCTGTNPVGSCSAADVARPWESLSLDHSDPAGVVFGPTGDCPLFLLSDSGISKTTDPASCTAWTTIPGGSRGYNALQIYDVASQVHPSHTDLYFGTQDNYLWASPDGGQSWPGYATSEGGMFQLVHATPNDTGPNNFVTFIGGGASFNVRTTPHMSSFVGWNDAPGVPSNAQIAPFLIEPNVYVQWAHPAEQDAILYMTTDGSTSWAPVNGATLRGTPGERMYIAGPAANPVIYQPYTAADGSIQIAKITNVRTAQATVTRIDQGFGRLGRAGFNYFSRNYALGVDPNDPNHLIAADTGTSQMKVSRDGGGTWTADTALTTAVTAGGFLFNQTYLGAQAQVISFNPANGQQIMVGTLSNGVVASSDGGATWFRVNGSTEIKTVTAFAWDELRREVIVSSYGRGLFKIKDDDVTGQLRLQYRVGDTSPTDQSINPRFKLFNDAASPVALSEVTIRYWYTIDGERAQQFWVDYAQQLPAGSVTGRFVKLATPRPGADTYAEVGFTAAAGNLPANDSRELHVRFNKIDWTNYNEIGDYSYVAGQYAFANAPKITVYRNGQLVWGTEP